MSEPTAPARRHRVRGEPDVPEAQPEPQVVDTPTLRVHNPGDLLGVVLSLLAIAAVMLLAVYAHGTTAGAAQDVQGFASLVRRILIFPVAVLEGLVTIFAPVAVLSELAIRRLGRQMIEVTTALVLALLLCTLATWAVGAFGSPELVSGLTILRDGASTLSIPSSLAALAGLLTAAGPRARRRTVAWSWNLTWVVLGFVLVTGQVSLPGAAVALLLGRAAGLGVRFASGVRSERAYGASLVAGISRAGFVPMRLVRVGYDADRDGEEGAGALGPELGGDAWAAAIARDSGNRVYDLTTAQGEDLSVIVLDGDRQVIGALSRLWRSLRLRGIEGRSFVSLRQAAERAALLAYAARAAGVRSPQLLAVAEAEDSMLLVQEQPGNAVPLRDLAPNQLTDGLLHEIWTQLRLAHDAGISHRALTSDAILVEHLAGRPSVWLVAWDSGDVASSQLARRMDLTQLVALLALRVGATRALESATAVPPQDDIAAIGPLLQTVALPRRTRDEMRAHREVLAELRSALVERLPEADVEPERLVRFGVRTVLTAILTLVAAIVLLTTINVTEIAAALETSDWRWSVVAFALGLVTFLGAALPYVAFSPVRLGLSRAVLVQVAVAFVVLAAPTGIGPAALNLRMLTKRGVTTSLAVATVALVQVSQVLVTVTLLVVLSLASGTNDAAQFTPSPGILVAIGAGAVLVAGSLLVPGVRRWIAQMALPTVRQTWPRLIEVVGQPGRVAVALGGNALMTSGWVLAFAASLAAFGQELSLIEVAVVYFVGNVAGSVIPTPGGIGTIEVALTGGLTAAGLNPGVAISVAILFRVVTYWLQIPLGWVAMRHLQRAGEL